MPWKVRLSESPTIFYIIVELFPADFVGGGGAFIVLGQHLILGLRQALAAELTQAHGGQGSLELSLTDEATPQGVKVLEKFNHLQNRYLYVYFFSSILKIRNNLVNLLSAFQTFMVKHYNSYFYQVFSKNMWFFIKDHGLHCHRYLCPCFCCIEFDLLSTFKELVPYSESVGENNVANSSHQFLKGDIAVCRWHLFLYNRYIGSGLIDHAYILQGVTNKFYNRN